MVFLVFLVLLGFLGGGCPFIETIGCILLFEKENFCGVKNFVL